MACLCGVDTGNVPYAVGRSINKKCITCESLPVVVRSAAIPFNRVHNMSIYIYIQYTYTALSLYIPGGS